MISRNQKKSPRTSRRGRVRKALARSDRARVTVYRSAKHIYAQLVDQDGKTLGTVSSRSKKVLGDSAPRGNVEEAKKVGAAVAELAKTHNVSEVVFNRNGFLYHGRVKALAEAAREAGLKF